MPDFLKEGRKLIECIWGQMLNRVTGKCEINFNCIGLILTVLYLFGKSSTIVKSNVLQQTALFHLVCPPGYLLGVGGASSKSGGMLCRLVNC